MAESVWTDVPTIDQKWLRCNGRQLNKLAKAGLVWLERNYQHVNALNVFPVPDGDTGTNMLLTMRSAYSRIQNSQETAAGRVAQELSQGALMGARGNSGVILSQIWRGLARSLHDKETFNASEMAAAMKEAAETAYKGVMRPVEGTILTVVREGSEEAVDAAGKSDDLRFVLERVLQRCRQALERTPDLLPILKQAGVVDSGGQGLVYILEGMLRYLNGELADVVYKPDVPVGAPAQALAAPAGGLEFPYDVQFIILGSRLNVGDVRQRIDAMGDSTVVVGDEKAIKVHVHVKDPGQPLSFGAGLGRLSDVVVENMQMQMEEIIRGEMKEEEARTTTPDDSSFILPPSFLQPGQIGVVAVASGNGLTRIFRELNVDQIVNGGQTNNPSTEEIFQAVQDVPTDKVIILPNNKNIILAAEAARALSPKNVAVVPSRTIPQGISALFHLARDGDLESVAAQMTAACHQVATGEITRATRSVHLDGVKVKKGELIGLANGRLCASGKELPDVLAHTLAQMGVAERELLSVYYGQDVRPEEAQQVAGQVAELYPEMEVELLDGGQAHYYYILGAE